MRRDQASQRFEAIAVRGQWLKYKHGEAWHIDCITLPQTNQGKHYMLTMVEVTTRWLETYPVPHANSPEHHPGP